MLARLAFGTPPGSPVPVGLPAILGEPGVAQSGHLGPGLLGMPSSACCSPGAAAATPNIWALATRRFGDAQLRARPRAKRAAPAPAGIQQPVDRRERTARAGRHAIWEPPWRAPGAPQLRDHRMLTSSGCWPFDFALSTPRSRRPPVGGSRRARISVARPVRARPAAGRKAAPATRRAGVGAGSGSTSSPPPARIGTFRPACSIPLEVALRHYRRRTNLDGVRSPQPLEYLIADVARRHGAVRVRGARCVVTDDAEQRGLVHRRGRRPSPSAPVVWWRRRGPALWIDIATGAGFLERATATSSSSAPTCGPSNARGPMHGRACGCCSATSKLWATSSASTARRHSEVHRSRPQPAPGLRLCTASSSRQLLRSTRSECGAGPVSPVENTDSQPCWARPEAT